MTVKLLTERHLEFLSLKGGCTGSSESTFVKMSNCWKSHALDHLQYRPSQSLNLLYNSVNNIEYLYDIFKNTLSFLNSQDNSYKKINLLFISFILSQQR